MNSLVKFYYGTQAEYNSLVSNNNIDSDNLYFILNSDQKLGHIYKGNTDVSDDVINVSTIPATGVTGKLYVSNQWTDSNNIYDARIWNGIAYESAIHHLTNNEILAQYLASDITDNLLPSHPVAMAPSERSKLAGIAAGAEVNVQSDWNQTITTEDAYIKNKPVITAAATDIVASGTKIPNTNAVAVKLQDYIPISGSSATIKSLYEANADTNAFTDSLKAKLEGIEAGAEVNIQADWNEASTISDAFIKNKPVIDNVSLANSNTNIPSSRLMNTILSGYLSRSNGSLTGPMFASNQKIYLGVGTSTAYIQYNTNTGGIDLYTA